MAYQNVGTPRFYINILEWLAATGHKALPVDVVYNYILAESKGLLTLPVEPQPSYSWQFGEDGIQGMTDNGFVALLGHNMSYLPSSLKLFNTSLIQIPFNKAIVNCELYNGGIKPTHSGFSIAEFPGTVYIRNFWLENDTSDWIGSLILGSYYDMPHSPDLKLTMTREMDGVKRVRTKGGSDLVAHKYIKPEMWGEAGAWELYLGIPGDEQKLSRSGRRTWGLSFSQLGGDDVFGSNQSLSQARFDQTDGIDESDTGLPVTSNYKYNVLTDDNFYSQVIHKTNGGQLPFIFQPDSSNNNPDGFAICKFDMNTFKFNQVANGVYNIKVKIREVW